MKNTIGVRREDLSKKGEKRVAVVPELAKEITQKGHRLLVQPATHPNGEVKRAFKDASYLDSGAEVQEDLSDADIVFGLKEVGIDYILPGKAMLFFSHTHKGQVKNRKMLQALLDKKSTVFDYELVNNDAGARIITSFTYFAGYAGQIDTIWAYGKRIQMMGIDHPFSKIPQSIETEDLGLIKNMLKEIGEDIKANGTPAELPPMINCILGKGKTSYGSQVIYDILPVKEITPAELEDTYHNGSRNQVYKLVLEIDQMFRLKEGVPGAAHPEHASDPIGLYFKHPEYFETRLEEVLPYISILMNCILWGPKYPRVLPRELMKSSWQEHQTLQAIGDITCDPEGSIEFSKETWIDSPVYIYSPASDTQTDGFDGEGVAVMAVTNLPCEFSSDASAQFSEDMNPILDNLLNADLSGSFNDSGLNDAWKGSCIMWKGELTEKYAYMKEYL